MTHKNKHNENEVFKKNAPILYNMKKVNNLRVPKDYFETLVDKVMEKVESENNQEKTTKVIPLRQNNWVKYFVAAASIAAILSLFFFLENKPVEFSEIAILEIQFEDLTAEEFTNEMNVSGADELLSYINFEDENNVGIETEYDFNETNLDMTLFEMDEYLSSDYDLDVEF